eukprot:6475572-Amphidinium_carterae.1
MSAAQQRTMASFTDAFVKSLLHPWGGGWFLELLKAKGVLGDMSYTIQTGLRRESGVKALLGELIELQQHAALSIANLQEEGKLMRIFAPKETLKY